MANKKPKNPSTSTANMIASVADKFELIPKKMTKEVIQSFLNYVEENISKGLKVRIDKLGVLAVKNAAARKGRNPQTGEEIEIPARKKIAFRVAKSLKEAVGLKKSAKPSTAKIKKSA